jgi:hypothetical protein
LPFDLQGALSHLNNAAAEQGFADAIISGYTRPQRDKRSRQSGPSAPLATERELSDFLKSVERRAFKRSVYHVRDEEAALDIVQDSMMKLAEHYGDKPLAELPMLFQRILSNCTLDWFRRQKTRNALFSNMSDFESASDDGDFDLLELTRLLPAPSRWKVPKIPQSGLKSCVKSRPKSRSYLPVNGKRF